MAKVESPVPLFTGVSVGVSFVDGVGHTDDEAALAYFEQAGYTVGGKHDPESNLGDETNVDKLTKADLLVLAQQKGITVPSTANKGDIAKLLSSKDAADPGSLPKEGVSETTGQTVPGDGAETGAADGAVFGATPATSDVNNENAAGKQV